jgi:multidrug resistance efflux pump
LKRQVEELKIRAGVSGVLQQLSIEGGQRVAVARALGG